MIIPHLGQERRLRHTEVAHPSSCSGGGRAAVCGSGGSRHLAALHHSDASQESLLQRGVGSEQAQQAGPPEPPRAPHPAPTHSC